MRISAIITACSILGAVVSDSAIAQSAVDPVAERLKRSIVFQAMFKTPNELDVAVMPYFECVMAEAGTKHLDAAGRELPTSESPSVGCYDVKEKSESDALKKLQSLGIASSEDRKLIVGNTLLAIELSAQGNVAWMRRAK